MTVDLVDPSGLITHRHITHDADVFQHEYHESCPCGPTIETALSAELAQGMVIFLHPILMEAT